MKDLFKQEAICNFEYMKEARRFLHTNPGTGFDIKKSAEFVYNELKKMGYSPEFKGKCGVVATVGDKTKNAILLRCDMDALMIKEEAEIKFPSQNGMMHACGHDMHTAMLLGCAKILKKFEKELKGCVKLMFQPAEEILEGSLDMINAGVLKSPDVKVALMVHVMTNVSFKCGTIIVSGSGITAPASQFFTIKIKGKGTHGSMPEKGVDPIITACHILMGLEEIKSRELSLTDEAALTIGSFNGGNSANVIPGEVVLKGSFRSFSDDVQEFIKNRLTQICETTAKVYRAQAEVKFDSSCPTLINDENISLCVLKYMKEILGDDYVLLSSDISGEKSSGSEDFSYISHKVPSVMVAIGAGETKNGYKYPLHHSKVMFDEEALINGSLVYAYTAYKFSNEYI